MPRAKPTPVLIHVRYEFGPVSLEVDVPAMKVSATIDAMVNVHKRAVAKHPECVPELSPVTSGMGITVSDDDDYGDRHPRTRAGFLS